MKKLFVTVFTVEQGNVGLLYKDGAYIKELPPGKYTFWKLFNATRWRVRIVDVRERSLVIKNQEILTKDKVAIRVSIIVYFKVKSAHDAIHNVSSYEERIYEDVQLAARGFLANESLEEILNARNKISASVREEVKAEATSYGVEIVKADVKDLVFPGNLREIMNQVLETERRAQAELINAQKEADVTSIKTKAENEANRLRNEADKEAMRIRAEAEKVKLAIQRESELEEAKLVKEHPEILKIRKLKTLAELARGGGRFIVGLKEIGMEEVLKD
jgi:regulator of protease activity HflC (stomatin/prohibitin superfamily)